jgi:hypothetical protein
MKDPKVETTGRMILATVAAWLMFLAVDFVLHAVFFAPWWKKNQEYWLPPLELFRMIPIAYLSFAVYCGALVWLFVRIHGDGRTLGAACRFGALCGLVFGVTTALANYSVFAMPRSMLVVWSVSFLIESTLACAAAFWVLQAQRPGRRVAAVFGAAVLLFIVAVVLQNLLFPTSSVFE